MEKDIKKNNGPTTESELSKTLKSIESRLKAIENEISLISKHHQPLIKK